MKQNGPNVIIHI